MKYCEECGAKLEDDAIFCEECGAKQSSVVSSEPNQDISPKPSDISASAGSTPIQNQNKNQNPVFETPAAPAKKASSKTAVYISVIVVCLAVIVGAVFLLYPKFIKNNNKPATEISKQNDFQKSTHGIADEPTAAPEITEAPTEKPTKKPKKKVKKTPEPNDYDDDYSDEDDYDDSDDYDYYDEYIIPDSDVCKITKSEVLALSKEERWIAKNEIYARYGRMFNNQDLQEYFDGLDWYIPTTSPDDFDESVFSKVEKYNVRLLAKYENQ